MRFATAAGLLAWIAAVAPGTGPACADPPSDFLLGADASALDRLDVRGVAYRQDDTPRAALGLMREAGFNTLTLQVLVDPANGYLGRTRSPRMGARIRGAGFRLLLELRCTNATEGVAADEVPVRWAARPDLAKTVWAYTRGTVEDFRVAGAMPEFVQIGHDLSDGFLDAHVAPDSDGAAWDHLAELVGAALAGVKASAPRAKTVLRLGGANAVWCATVVDSLAARDVRFDLVGISWLPWYEGTLTELKEALATLSPHAPGGVLVLETAYPWTLRGFDDTLDEVSQPSQLHPGYEPTPEGQARWFTDVLAVVRETPGGTGVFWGDPFSIAARGVPTARENLALFDERGTVLPALNAGQ